jgi:hypothetical protein
MEPSMLDSSDDESSLESDERNSHKRRHLVALVTGYILVKRNKRRKYPSRRGKKCRVRKHPDVLLQESLNDGMFQREYRMSHIFFCKLFNDLFGDGLYTSPRNRRDGVILPKTKLMMMIRYLAGASYLDILRIHHGVSKQAVFKHIAIVLKLIANSESLGVVEWPDTLEACNKFALQWAGKSGPSAFRGLHQTCIGAIDGILIETRSPTKNETMRPNDFRSGHKKQIGLNVQAICDARLRFMAISCRCPGKTNDWMAYLRSTMSERTDNLPPPFYIVGDAAYVNSEHLLVPYPGGTFLDQREDAYNLYLSQLRIRIEQAFALLIGRWGVFWRPLRVPLRQQPTLILATCKLHNFCIDEREACELPAYPNGDSTPAHCTVGHDGIFLQHDV